MLPRMVDQRAKGSRALAPVETKLIELLGRVRVGDRRAERSLFGQLRGELRAAARARLPDGAARGPNSSDLAQRASVRLFLNLDRFRGTTDPELRAYALRILGRLMIDDGRAARCRKRDLRDPAVLRELRERLAALPARPSELLRNKEQHQNLWALLPQLTRAQRVALALRAQGRSLREIAAQLAQDNEAAAANTLLRATRRIQALLAGGADAGDGEPGGDEVDPRLLLAVRNYLYAIERGAPPAREALLAEHPAELTGPLRDLLAGLDETLALLRAAVAAERGGEGEP